MKNIMDQEQILRATEKIAVYEKQKATNFNQITSTFHNMQNNYNSSNSKKITNLIIEMQNMENKIQENEKRYIEVLENVIKKYQETASYVERTFNDRGE